MASSRLLVPAVLLGLAAVGRGIVTRGSTPTAPFDPASDGILIYLEGKTGTTSLQNSAGVMMEPPCQVSSDGAAAKRSVKCHSPECSVPFLKNRPEGSRTWVITSNRNPFTMYPSTMFQVVGHWSNEKIASTTMAELMELFHEKAHGTLHGAPHAPMTWYKQHYYVPFGLNVTDHPFDFNKKLLHLQHTWENRHPELLFVRLEDSHDWEAILRPFFPKMELLSSNEAADKVYESKYKQFVSELQYTDKEIEVIGQSESLNHFYNPTEKAAFIAGARTTSSRMANIYSDDLIDEDKEGPFGC